MATQDRYPTSDIATGNWFNTPCWSRVDDDKASPDDATTAIATKTTTPEDYLAGFSAFSIPNGATISSITITYRHVWGSDPAGSIKSILRVNGTTYTTDPGYDGTLSWTSHSYDWTVNPETGSSWNVADINGTGSHSLQGFGVRATNTSNYWQYVTQIYATVTYTLNLATVTTSAVTGILVNTATGHGEVTADGGAAVTERGVCWKTSTSPTTADSKATSGTGTGTFDPSMTGLAPGVLYYVRAYAINSVGTAYGSEVTFTSGVAIGSGGSGACSSGYPMTTDGW